MSWLTYTIVARGIRAEVDLSASDEAGEPVVTVTDVGPL
jgi:hypothetical protein